MGRSRYGRSVASLLRIRSLGAVGVAAVLLFYVAWPLYAGYDLKASLDGRNVEAVDGRVDFPSLRASLRPAVAAKVDEVMSTTLRKAGTAGGALLDRLKAQAMPAIVDGVLATLVTPEMLIRIHTSGKSLKETLDSLVLERASRTQGVGGGLTIVSEDKSAGNRRSIEEIADALGIETKTVLGNGAADTAGHGDADAALAAKSKPGPKYGLGNIKHFSLSGPLQLSIGVARDANARQSDLTANLTFVGGSWKLTGIDLAH